MARNRQDITLFLDSSVLFTAVNSPFGGSAKLFTLKRFKLVATPVVLAEVERNVRRKLRRYHLDRLYMLVKHIDIIDLEPKALLIKKALRVIVKKDAVILSQAKQIHVDFLVTLDKRHFDTEKVAVFLTPKQVVAPGDLLQGKLKGKS